ncbi:hypothetical protein [Chlamydia sp. 04-14]|uniref:hypothetical protein n=1 Tax=Chlamydia TaxID=810 RepID=UPI002FC97D60
MKSVPSSSSTLVELTCLQRCCFSGSRVHKVANIIAMIIGILILAGGVVSVVLFGAELGALYTMIVLGASVAVGILLLTVGASCLSCRALSPRQRSLDISKYRIDDEQIQKLKNKISNNAEDITKAQEYLIKAVDRYQKVSKEHKKLLENKNEINKKLEIASKKYSEARLSLNAFLEKIQKESTNSSGGLSRVKKALTQSKNTLEEASAAYQKIWVTLEDLNKAIFEKEKALDSLNLVAIYDRMQVLLNKQVSTCSSLINIMEQRIIALQARLADLQEEELKLQQRLQDLKLENTAERQTREKLEKALASLQKEKGKSQQELKKRLDQLAKQKDETGKIISDTKDQLNNQQILCVLEERIAQLEQQLGGSQSDVEEKENRIQALEQELKDLTSLSMKEKDALRDQIEKLCNQTTDDNQKIIELEKQGQTLLVLSEKNKILQKQLDQLEERREREAIAFEDCLNQLDKLRREDSAEFNRKLEEEFQKRLRSETNYNSMVRTYSRDMRDKDSYIREIEEQLISFRNTLVAYNQVIESYEKKIAELRPELSEEFREDIVVIKEAEGGRYTRKEVRAVQDAFMNDQINNANRQILQLQQRIEDLEQELADLKAAPTFFPDEEDIENVDDANETS